MSYHILHLQTHGSYLAKERGSLVMKIKNGEGELEVVRKMPLEDIRAVIVAARGVQLSMSLQSALLENEAIILHCDTRYQPIGITTPLARVIDTPAFLQQGRQPKALNERLWRQFLTAKTINQSIVLEALDRPTSFHLGSIEKKRLNEAHLAKVYWELYFPSIGWEGSKRSQDGYDAPNKMLNYGYAVLSALIHRSLIVHGLSPLFGIHHIPRYRSDALVYDVIEPFRPFVDLMLAQHLALYESRKEVELKKWSRHVGQNLKDLRVIHDRYSLKLMDAIDKCASSLAKCYSKNTSSLLWIPELPLMKDEQDRKTLPF